MPRVTSRKQFLFASVLILLAIVVAPAFAQEADLSRLVVVGDSLSAGYQNGSLLWSQQEHGYASLVAKQARVPLVLPLIADPGVPPVLELKSVNPLVIQPSTATIPAMPRLNPTQQATDLAVPGDTVADALTKLPCISSATDFIMTNLVLGIPGCYLQPPIVKTQIQWAQALHPTTVLVWLGNNDALGAATNGSAKVTPLADFEAAYTKAIDALTATHAKLVIANIPDVTAIPFFFSVPKLAAMFGVPEAVIMSRLNLGPGDFVVLDDLSTAAAILKTGTGTLPDSAVLTSTEAAAVSEAIDQYNIFIASEARRVGAPLVDIHRLMQRVGARGLVINGQRLTTNFLGGVFSLDGIHPTNTGYAVVANEFIMTINRAYHTEIPPVSVSQVAKTDPLVLPGIGHPPEALKKGDLDGMRGVLTH